MIEKEVAIVTETTTTMIVFTIITYSDIDLDGVEDQEERRRQQQRQEQRHLNQHHDNHQPEYRERRRTVCCAACCPTWNDIKSYCYNCTAPKGEYRGVW
jgi:hypothetical protein